ncbi:hypothetical protein [Emergencia sp.]|uniref:hypothetical protein n=1 Tax=Emergencia sp. TaxID=1926557 RepID=UPI003AEF2D9F
MNYRDATVAQLAYLRHIVKIEKRELRAMPSGNLKRKKSHGRTHYYLEKKGNLISLRKQPKVKETYLLKEQLTQRIHNAEMDIPLLERLLKRYQPVIETDEYWNKLQPDKDEYREKEKIHRFKGIKYRSKSEIIIAEILHSYGIAYQYEIKVKVNGRKYRSDFRIKRPKDNKEFIWEHFGLTDDENYLQRTYSKLENYHDQGIDLWDNLLISFDQVDGGIDVDVIDKIVRVFLL